MNFNKVITSVRFGMFNAHCFFAAFCVIVVASIFSASVAVLAALVVAAGKEFWYDLKYEKYPPQTVMDSAVDFAEYCVGIALGGLVVLWKPC